MTRIFSAIVAVFTAKYTMEMWAAESWIDVWLWGLITLCLFLLAVLPDRMKT